jgi:large subunit ribosomal protein L11
MDNIAVADDAPRRAAVAPKNELKKIKIALQAGDAALIDLGKMLGPLGIPAMQVKRVYDEQTADQRGDIIPAVITVREDRSWTIDLRTPPTSFLIRRALGTRGSGRPGHRSGGTLTPGQLREIAQRKLPDLNTTDIGAAMRQIAGTAQSMGVAVTGQSSGS